jgi:hypothetical protein
MGQQGQNTKVMQAKPDRIYQAITDPKTLEA